MYSIKPELMSSTSGSLKNDRTDDLEEGKHYLAIQASDWLRLITPWRLLSQDS